MSHVNLTYFQKNDDLSSSTYNDNLSKWTDASNKISSDNVRDQGLDMHSFAENTAIDHESLKHHPTLMITDLDTVVSLPPLSVPQIVFDEHDETYLYRCSFDWRYDGMGSSGGTTPPDTFFKIFVFFTLKSDEISGTSSLSGTRSFQIPRRLNYAKHITGDCTVTKHITKSRLNFNSSVFTNLMITPNILISKGNVTLPTSPQVYISMYTSSLTKFIGGV